MSDPAATSTETARGDQAAPDGVPGEATPVAATWRATSTPAKSRGVRAAIRDFRAAQRLADAAGGAHSWHEAADADETVDEPATT